MEAFIEEDSLLALNSSVWKLRNDTMAMKLKGRVMKGASSLPMEFRRALETNTLKIGFVSLKQSISKLITNVL